MRILFVWFTALSLLGFVTLTWYISQPIIVGIIRSASGTITLVPWTQIPKFIEIVNYIWGPLFDLIIVGWAIISSQKRDIESEVYG